MHLQLLSTLLLGGLASACPLAARQSGTATAAVPGASPTAVTGSGSGSGTGSGSGSGSGVTVDAAALQAILPSSGSCAGADFPDECRTAEQAAPFVTKACAKLNKAECAATIALMGYESGDFKFKHNVTPGVPGQGTANMMSPTFVSEYATSLFGASAVSGKTPADVLALVMPDEHNFGSAAWYYTNKCTADVQSSLKTGSEAGWAAYAKCIGGDPATFAARSAYWTRAKKALGV